MVEQQETVMNSFLGDHLTMTLTLSAAAVAGVALYLNRPKYGKIPVNLDDQSVEVQPGVRRSRLRVGDGSAPTYTYEDATTLHEVFMRGLRVSNNGPYLGTRRGPNLEYEWRTYQEVFDKAKMFGSALLHLGLQPGDESFVGIYSQNREEFSIVGEACNMYSLVTVPIYETLGDEACRHILKQTGMRFLVCDTDAKVSKILSFVTPSTELKYIIPMVEISSTTKTAAEQAGVEILSFQDTFELGSKHSHELVPPKPENATSICYTSGTTGNPKGAILSHRNCLATGSGFLAQCQLEGTTSDSMLSYLPMAHIFEKLLQLHITQVGGRIGFFRGDPKLLLEDLQALKPTAFATVPRLLNKIYDKVMITVCGSRIKKFLFDTALSRKMVLLQRGIITGSSIWDKLVFHKFQQLLGGEVRTIFLGGAPLGNNVCAFARCAFGCPVFEGYGLTELTGSATGTLPFEWRSGHVGVPIPGTLIKLLDVPDMDYHASDGKGEICVKGPGVMVGYYRESEKTAEILDSDGWIHTGDIGQWLPEGCLKIIDRRKHMFKLAQGEYIAPEKIENIYTRSLFVAQAFVDGNSFQPYPVGVIVPDPDVLPGWAEDRGISGNMEELCQNKEVHKAIYDDIILVGKNQGLKGFEQVKAIHLHPELFTVESGHLTPTMKAKRPALRKLFAERVEELYSSL